MLYLPGDVNIYKFALSYPEIIIDNLSPWAYGSSSQASRRVIDQKIKIMDNLSNDQWKLINKANLQVKLKLVYRLE